MIDFISGVVIGVVAAIAVCVAWFLRVDHAAAPWVILSGFAIGSATAFALIFSLFCWVISQAFRF